jgi:TP901 family phage tail tape measure protein
MTNKTVEAVMRLSAKLGPMAAFGQMANKLNQVNQKALAFNKTQAAISRTMNALPIGRFLGPAVAGYAITQAVNKFADVERQLTRIGLTLGASRDEMKGLYQDVNRAAESYALNSDQVMETVGAYAAAGASLADIRNDLDLLTKAQQALGASGEDVVNSWNTAQKSLGLTTKDAEKFFSIIAAGSAAGKFEASDMSRFLPSLLPSAAKQGFEGNDGAQRMVGFLEVMANYTGTVGEAATSVGDFLEKLSSPDVENRLGKISGTFLKRMSAARENGEDMLKVMHDILMEATGGKADRLGQIFGDKEARQAATVVLTKFYEIMAAQKEIANRAPGVLDRNNKELLDDTKAGLDGIKQTLSELTVEAGQFAASLGVLDTLKYVTDNVKYMNAVNAGLEQSGVHGFAARTAWGLTSSQEEKDRMARIAGYLTAEEKASRKAHKQYGETRRAAAGREDMTYGAGVDANGVPIPVPLNGDPSVPLPPYQTSRPNLAGRGPRRAPPENAWSAPLGAGADAGSQPAGDWFNPLGAGIEQKMGDGGREAGEAFAKLIAGLGAQLAAEFNKNVRPLIVQQQAGLPKANANTGQSTAGRIMGPR